MQERVRPNGSHRAVRAKKTGSCRRPHTEAHPWPVWGALVCHHQRGWAAHGAPPLVALGAAPMTHLQRLRTPSLDLDLLGMEVLQDAMIHRVQVRCRLFHALSTVVGPLPWPAYRRRWALAECVLAHTIPHLAAPPQARVWHRAIPALLVVRKHPFVHRNTPRRCLWSSNVHKL